MIAGGIEKYGGRGESSSLLCRVTKTLLRETDSKLNPFERKRRVCSIKCGKDKQKE